MRLGKLGKRERIGGNVPTKKSKKSRRSFHGTEVGYISTNLINSIYLPLFIEVATRDLEAYLAAKINYDDYLEAQQNTKEVEVGVDGATMENQTVTPMEPPVPPTFRSQVAIDDFKDTMEDIAKHFAARGGWKVHANAAKFERQLDEKYGVFRPLITNHPEIEQFIRTMQRKYLMGEFSPIRQGPPPISRTTTIVLLFMMQGKVKWQIMVLIALFLLVGLQPWALVCLVAILHFLMERRRTRPVGKIGRKDTVRSVKSYYHNQESKNTETDLAAHKHSFLLQPVGTKLEDGMAVDTDQYDTMILGYGAGALYAAALLSRTGRKVLVVSPFQDASGCLTLEHCKDASVRKKFRDVPFDVEASNVSRVTRQQDMLAPALCTETDYQGGVRFAQIGTEADGYAFEILSIPGMGTAKLKDEIPFVLRATGGPPGLMDDTARLLGDGWPGSEPNDIGNSTAGAYMAAVAAMNVASSEYYMSKILPENVNELRGKNNYKEASIRHASNFLNQVFPLNAHVRSLMAGIGMKGENLKPSKASMGAHITNICASVGGEGMHYPVGGPRALCRALATVVEQCGGKIITGAPVKELLFDLPANEKPKPRTESEMQDVPNPRCIGVKLANDRKLVFKKSPQETAVISTYGYIDTFIRFLPDSVRNSFKVPKGLPALTERRPVFKILFALKGSAAELDVTGADFYRLPAASLATDEVNPDTGEVTCGEIGAIVDSDDDDADGTTEDGAVSAEQVNAVSAEPTPRRPKKSRRVRYHSGSSWLHISFPSAKDPSFEERHGNITTCVVTVEADDDFNILFDTRPRIYTTFRGKPHQSEDAQRLVERVQRDVIECYPQLGDKIAHTEVHGPFRRGLSHSPERYAAKGIHTSTTFPGLYMGGSDLTVGESFAGSIVGGWLAANAVMEYETLDYMFLGKNITADLKLFTDQPVIDDDDEEEDVAVPITPKEVAPVEEDETQPKDTDAAN